VDHESWPILGYVQNITGNGSLTDPSVKQGNMHFMHLSAAAAAAAAETRAFRISELWRPDLLLL